MERFAWDGSSVLYEIRRPLHHYAWDPDEESDTLALVPQDTSSQFVHYCYDVYGNQYECPSTGTDTLPSNAQRYGRVLYTNGTDIDTPLDIIRLGYYSSTNSPIVIVPETNWRGVYDGGILLNGSPMIDWPGHRVESYYLDPGRNDPQPSWFGDVIHGQRDGSGLLYKRNRYYDPMTGRFTQEDPIGIAGGLNLYGFAGGDPVNHSDPFGLQTDCLVLPCPVVVGGAAVGGPLTVFGAAVLAVVVADRAANGSDAGESATPPAAAPTDATHVRRPTPGEIAGAVGESGATVTPHPTKTGEGTLIKWSDGSITDIRVETHPIPGSKGKPVKHGNVDAWDPQGNKVTEKHIVP